MSKPVKMEFMERERLIKKRAVAKGMLSRMLTFLETGNTDVDEIQVRCNKLPDILAKYEASQEELECNDSIDHTEDRVLFEQQYIQVEIRFRKLLHLAKVPSLPDFSDNISDNASEHSSGASNHAGSMHLTNSHIKLPVIELPNFTGDQCKWLHFRDTFQALIVNNVSLSSVQRLHYLVSSLKGEPKELISNLSITNDNFAVAWKLITERYNNVKLIAMKHVSQLLQMPQTKRGDAISLRQLINHITSNMNAIEALSLNTTLQTLMLNQLLLSVLDPDERKAWELQTAGQEDIPSTPELITFLEQRCKALELLHASQLISIPASRDKHASAGDNRVSRTARAYVTSSIECLLCKESHRLMNCDKFINLSPQRCFEFVRKSKLCFNCLQPFTRGHACSTFTCKQCNKRHHTLLHGASYNQTAEHNTALSSVVNKNPPLAEATTYCSFKGRPATQVLLATAIVDVQTRSKQYAPCRVLLDSASQLHFISEQCVKRLCITKQQSNTFIQGVNETNTSTQHNVSVQLRSRYINWQSNITCALLPRITDHTPTSRLDISSWKLPKGIQLADEQFNEPGPVDILLGAKLFFKLLLPECQTKRGYPVLQETVLGWVLSGSTPTTNPPRVRQQSFFSQDTASVELNLNRFWELEEAEFTSMTPEQTACEQHFVSHTIQQADGRFVVRLPLKMESTKLGASCRMAENRLLAIERRLDRNLDLKKQYHKFMHEYENSGHMEVVQPQLDNNTVCYYLPHHPVFKETSSTTKTRVVFDGGAKTSTGLSLNEILQIEPTIQEDLYSLVLRFRTYQVCFTADIAQMYRQILLNVQDRNLQRILWRYSSDKPIQEYQLTTVTYGTACAPFLATRCLKKLAEDNLTLYPKAALALLNDFYVDDVLTGASTVQEAIEIQQELTTLLATAGFLLRKWVSNDSLFLATIPEELQETNHTVSLDNKDSVTTLGLQWNSKTDELQVRNNNPLLHVDFTASTK
jgi:hypothetical protein